MNTHVDKIQKNKSQAVANNLPKLQSNGESTFQFLDNTPEAIAQRKLQESINNSPRVKQLKAYQKLANNSPQVKYLPHKALHSVQQKQGRVKPTVQMKDANINDDSESIVQRFIYLGESKKPLTDQSTLEELKKLVTIENHEILEQAFIHSIVPIRGNDLQNIANQINRMGDLRNSKKPWADIPDDPSPIFYGVASPEGAPRLRNDKLGSVGRLLYMNEKQGREIIDFKNINDPTLLLHIPFSETIQENSSPLGLIGAPSPAPQHAQPQVALQLPQVGYPQPAQPQVAPPPPPPLRVEAKHKNHDPKDILDVLRMKDTFKYHEKTAARKIGEGVKWKNPYVDKGGVGKWYNTSKRGIDWATTNGKVVYFALDNLDDTSIPDKEGKAGTQYHGERITLYLPIVFETHWTHPG